jgi:hypothetical protein
VTKASDNEFPSLLVKEGTAPSSPAAGDQRVYIDSTTHHITRKNSSGTVTDIEAGSGMTNPMTTAEDIIKGGSSGTPARLAVGAAGGALVSLNGTVAYNSGTSFPGSKATGDRYWRTDLGLECYWDGTRWVTTQMFSMAAAASDSLDGASTNINYARMSPWHTTNDLWLDAFYASVYCATTNDGSNFWTLTFDKWNAAGANTNLATFNTSADTVNNYSTHRVSIAAALGTFKHFTIATTKTGSPGAIYIGAHFTYRLIVT